VDTSSTLLEPHQASATTVPDVKSLFALIFYTRTTRTKVWSFLFLENMLFKN